MGEDKMGNQAGSLKKHLETAEKTGALNFTDKGLEKFPPDLVKVVGNLRNLDLSNNLKHLAIVDLSSNRLTSVPGEVGQLEATELVLNCNQISHLATEISKCPRLKTLRMEENCLALDSIPKALLAESGVSLLALEGNLFDVKKLDEVEGFDKYMERYTAVKRKLD